MLRYFGYSVLIHLGIFGSIYLYQILPEENSHFFADVQVPSTIRRKRANRLEAIRYRCVDEEKHDSVNAPMIAIKEDGEKERKSGNHNRTEIIRGRISNYLLHIEYPPLARRLGMEGRVLIRILVDCNGNLSGKELIRSSGHALLDDAAMQGVSGWSFGSGEEASLVVPVLFRLK